MTLEEKRIYSTQDMMCFFGVNKDTWKKKRKALLNHLAVYYDYEICYDIKDMRRRNYKINAVLKEYEPFPRKKTREENNAVYEQKIEAVIRKDSIQTAKNVSRIIKDDSDIKALNHKESTQYDYTRKCMKTMFGTKENNNGTKGYIDCKIWCKHDKNNNCYIPLSTNEQNNFIHMMKKERDDLTEIDLTILSDYENGLISKDEMNKELGNNAILAFLIARDKFFTIYEYYPIKVPVYKLLD